MEIMEKKMETTISGLGFRAGIEGSVSNRVM